MSETLTMDRNLALEAVRVTEVAALAASRLMGRGDEKPPTKRLSTPCAAPSTCFPSTGPW